MVVWHCPGGEPPGWDIVGLQEGSSLEVGPWRPDSAPSVCRAGRENRGSQTLDSSQVYGWEQVGSQWVG